MEIDAVVEKIEAETAFLKIGGKLFAWPAKSLPANIKTGEKIFISLQTEEEKAKAKINSAKNIINEIIET